jgi:hypothetical protein
LPHTCPKEAHAAILRQVGDNRVSTGQKIRAKWRAEEEN